MTGLRWKHLAGFFMGKIRIPGERATAAERGYGHQWRKAREAYLADHPLCVRCEELGITRLATIVDHIKPHRGEQALFWDAANWQALCERCHNSHKRRLERSGRVVGCDAEGRPLEHRQGWDGGRGG